MKAQKYSISATLRNMKIGQSFKLPINGSLNAACALAHTGAKQLQAKVSTRADEKGKFIRVFLTELPKGGLESKIPYPIESGVKMAASKSGRPARSKNKETKATTKAKAKVPAKASKAKKAAPKAQPKNIKSAKAVLTPAKTSKKK